MDVLRFSHTKLAELTGISMPKLQKLHFSVQNPFKTAPVDTLCANLC